jgi:hypothetical protein
LGIDAGSKLSAAGPESVAGGTDNAFCLEAQSSDGKYTAWTFGPAMQGVTVNNQPVDGNVYVDLTANAPACP